MAAGSDKNTRERAAEWVRLQMATSSMFAFREALDKQRQRSEEALLAAKAVCAPRQAALSAKMEAKNMKADYYDGVRLQPWDLYKWLARRPSEGIKLPETVLFASGSPAIWLRNDKRGKLVSRSITVEERALLFRRIVPEETKETVERGTVVAVIKVPQWGKGGHNRHRLVRQETLNAEVVPLFNESAMLQSYIRPHGAKAAVYRVSWTEGTPTTIIVVSNPLAFDPPHDDPATEMRRAFGSSPKSKYGSIDRMHRLVASTDSLAGVERYALRQATKHALVGELDKLRERLQRNCPFPVTPSFTSLTADYIQGVDGVWRLVDIKAYQLSKASYAALRDGDVDLSPPPKKVIDSTLLFECGLCGQLFRSADLPFKLPSSTAKACVERLRALGRELPLFGLAPAHWMRALGSRQSSALHYDDFPACEICYRLVKTEKTMESVAGQLRYFLGEEKPGALLQAPFTQNIFPKLEDEVQQYRLLFAFRALDASLLPEPLACKEAEIEYDLFGCTHSMPLQLSRDYCAINCLRLHIFFAGPAITSFVQRSSLAVRVRGSGGSIVGSGRLSLRHFTNMTMSRVQKGWHDEEVPVLLELESMRLHVGVGLVRDGPAAISASHVAGCEEGVIWWASPDFAPPHPLPSEWVESLVLSQRPPLTLAERLQRRGHSRGSVAVLSKKRGGKVGNDGRSRSRRPRSAPAGVAGRSRTDDLLSSPSHWLWAPTEEELQAVPTEERHMDVRVMALHRFWQLLRVPADEVPGTDLRRLRGLLGVSPDWADFVHADLFKSLVTAGEDGRRSLNISWPELYCLAAQTMIRRECPLHGLTMFYALSEACVDCSDEMEVEHKAEETVDVAEEATTSGRLRAMERRLSVRGVDISGLQALDAPLTGVVLDPLSPAMASPLRPLSASPLLRSPSIREEDEEDYDSDEDNDADDRGIRDEDEQRSGSESGSDDDDDADDDEAPPLYESKKKKQTKEQKKKKKRIASLDKVATTKTRPASAPAGRPPKLTRDRVDMLATSFRLSRESLSHSRHIASHGVRPAHRKEELRLHRSASFLAPTFDPRGLSPALNDLHRRGKALPEHAVLNMLDTVAADGKQRRAKGGRAMEQHGKPAALRPQRRLKRMVSSMAAADRKERRLVAAASKAVHQRKRSRRKKAAARKRRARLKAW